MFDGLTIGWETLDPYFFSYNVDICVGGTKVNKGDVVCKGKSEGKATKFYMLCNFKINVRHFKMASQTFNIIEGF